MKARLIPLLSLLAAALLGGAVAAVIVANRDPSHTTTVVTRTVSPSVTSQLLAQQVRQGGLTPAEIYRRDAPGVVVVTAHIPGTSNGFFGTPAETALGSGFVIDSQGHILTNAHVVTGAKTVTVGFSSSSGLDNTYKARVLGIDRTTDVAVLQPQNVPKAAMHPLQMGSSRTVQVGDPVVAIGNPLGEERTITAGIVSAVNRTITSPNNHPISGVIQTDAAINHGNSGGPLIDNQGKVIGITSQILTDSSSAQSGNIGIGFAVPINTALGVARQIIHSGHAVHTYLGISGQALTASLAHSFFIPTTHGVLVEKVQANSPAARAGLHGGSTEATINGVGYLLGGDVIIAVDGKPVIAFSDLQNDVSSHKPGQSITLTVIRDGKTLQIHATLGAD